MLSSFFNNSRSRLTDCVLCYRSSSSYQDEADKFYANPSQFITEKVLSASSKSSPDYVVVFDSLLEMPDQGRNGTVGSLLQDQGHYTEVRH